MIENEIADLTQLVYGHFTYFLAI